MSRKKRPPALCGECPILQIAGSSADGCQMALALVFIHGLQGGDEIIDAAELAVNGCKADVGHFADVLELAEHDFTNFSAAHLTATALLQFQFQIFNQGFELCGAQAGLFAGSVQTVEQFAPAEDLPASVAFHHRDRHGFNALICGEANFTVQALPSSPNAAATISSARFQDAAVCVLARGALHALITQKDVPTLDIDLSLEKGLQANSLMDELLRLFALE